MTHTGPDLPPAAWGDYFAEQLGKLPLMVILRGVAPDDAVATARAAWDAGVDLVEVTIERPEGVEALAAIVRDGGSQRTVGAGTLTTPERVRTAHEAGAAFGVAPGLDDDTVRAAADLGMPFLPGVATASEVTRAAGWGMTAVKAFPASTLGPGWISAMAGPFPELQVVATGGVNAGNAPDYLAAGALAVGMGGAVTQGGGLAELARALRR